MKEMKFNSQICTTSEQSERLLELGVKPGTADCTLAVGEMGKYVPIAGVAFPRRSPEVLPAWSLHRLLELNLLCCEQHFAFQFHITNIDNAYEYLINHTAWLIKEGYFNTEYLQEQAGSSREGIR